MLIMNKIYEIYRILKKTYIGKLVTVTSSFVEPTCPAKHNAGSERITRYISQPCLKVPTKRLLSQQGGFHQVAGIVSAIVGGRMGSSLYFDIVQILF